MEDGALGGPMEAAASLVAGWLLSLEATGPATAVRESVWLYPVVEVTHILGFVLLVGAAVMFDLRLLGLSRTIPVRTMAAHLLPWSRTGFALVVPTGLLMFISDATMTAANPAFRLKLALIGVALINVWTFHRGVFRSVSSWDHGRHSPALARLAAAVSICVWTAVIAAGRFIAYF